MPGFLYSQLFTRLPLETQDLSGKTVIVTGANVGLGKETARHLAAMKPSRLILACRNLEKAQDALEDIIQSTGNSNIEVWQLDLSDFSSVRAFAKKLNGELNRLDIFVQNAGVAMSGWNETKDGYEITLQVNVISTLMLALLSLPKLRETVRTFKTRPRLCLVGSEVHFWSKFQEHTAPNSIEALNDKSIFNAQDRYLVSKLLDMFITRELGERLATSTVAEDRLIQVNCPNPGLCHSELSRDAGLSLYLMKLALARTTEYGARNFVFAALAEQEDRGPYVSDCGFHEPSDFVISGTGQKVQKKVWRELTAIIEDKAPDAAKISA